MSNPAPAQLTGGDVCRQPGDQTLLCCATAHLTSLALPSALPGCPLQTRGNQRDTDRARAAKRNEKFAKDKNDDGLTPLQRKERDAKALQEKLAKKAAAEAAKK
jgi:hypothetical protein